MYQFRFRRALGLLNKLSFDGKIVSFCTFTSNVFAKSDLYGHTPSITRKCLLMLLKDPILREFRGFSSLGVLKESQSIVRSSQIIEKVQTVVMEYLHGTRGLHFTDAEHMSKNSPTFLDKLLTKFGNEEDVSKAIVRYFRFHPINELELFFESIGIKPNELSLWLPRDQMFLSDDELLLENYHVLCNYGIDRGNIGRIYRESTEFFKYDFGILVMKLRFYERMGFKKTTVCKIITCSPILLLADMNGGFLKVIEELNKIGIERDWVGGVLSEENTYNWDNMLVVLRFLEDLGFSKQDLEILIRKQPGYLLDGSGKAMFFLAGLLLKSGETRDNLFTLLSQFPNIQFGIFTRNLRQGVKFLIDLEMDYENIEKIVLSHLFVLASSPLKKANTVVTSLSTSKRRLCKIVKEDPDQLKKYALGLKINPLPNSDENEKSLEEKIKFLLCLGFKRNSKEMEKALNVCRGKGDQLQERYDLFVNAGLDPVDVCNMIRMSPHILNQKVEVLKKKISFLVTDMGYPVSSLVAFPGYMAYTVERVNLRLSMYNWLKARGKVNPALALSSILACTEGKFMKRYVNQDPGGPEVWENLKRTLSSG